MTRDITAGVLAAVRDGQVRPMAFVQLGFDGGTVYLNSTDKDIVWTGFTFLGVGDLGQISGLQETNKMDLSGISLTLTGVSSTHINNALTEDYSGRVVKIWEGLLVENTYALIADPVLLFQGVINTMNISLGDTGAVILTAESDLARWRIPVEWRYTDGDHQSRHSGDLFFQPIKNTVEKELIWGGKRALPASGGTAPRTLPPQQYDGPFDNDPAPGTFPDYNNEDQIGA